MTEETPSVSEYRLTAAPDDIDGSWAEAETALGEYWRVRSLVEVAKGWEAVATDGNRIRHAVGRTPGAALRALLPRSTPDD